MITIATPTTFNPTPLTVDDATPNDGAAEIGGRQPMAADHGDPLQRFAADQGLHPAAPTLPRGELHTRAQPGAQGPASSGANASEYVGMTLGVNGYGEAVVVRREIGSLRGYGDRLQAIAVARLGGAEPAAVVQDRNGRWHALETTAVFHGSTYRAHDTPTLAAYGLPSAVAIDGVRIRIAALQQELDALGPADYRGDRGDRLRQDLGGANRQLASLVLGVAESELQLNVGSSSRVPGKVNITGRPGRDSAGAAHGTVGNDGTFDPRIATAFEINRSELDKPVRAQAALFHEVTHLADYKLAQAWVLRYEASGRIFVAGEPGQRPLGAWLQQEVKAGRISAADAEVVLDHAGGRSATTEARANVRTFMALLQAHTPERATQELVAYAKALPPGSQYASPPSGSKVTTALRAELQAEYARMTPQQRMHYDAAVAAAVKANPDAWISELRMKK